MRRSGFLCACSKYFTPKQFAWFGGSKIAVDRSYR